MGLTYVPNTAGPNDTGGGGGASGDVVINDSLCQNVITTNVGNKQFLEINVTVIASYSLHEVLV